MDCAKGTRLEPKPMNSKVMGVSAAETAGTAQEQGDQDVNDCNAKDMPKGGAMEWEPQEALKQHQCP